MAKLVLRKQIVKAHESLVLLIWELWEWKFQDTTPRSVMIIF